MTPGNPSQNGYPDWIPRNDTFFLLTLCAWKAKLGSESGGGGGGAGEPIPECDCTPQQALQSFENPPLRSKRRLSESVKPNGAFSISYQIEAMGMLTFDNLGLRLLGEKFSPGNSKHFQKDASASASDSR